MVILLLSAVEGDGVGVLNGHGKGGLTGGLAGVTDQEARVEATGWLAGTAGASSSLGNSVVLKISAGV